MQGATAGGITVYPSTIRIDNTQGLLPGMNADIEIVVEDRANALTVPVAAVDRNGMVLVKGEGTSPEGFTAPEGYHYVEVKTGMTTEDYIEITEGLSEGDIIGVQQRTASNMFEAMGNIAQNNMPMNGMAQGERPQGGMPR